MFKNQENSLCFVDLGKDDTSKIYNVDRYNLLINGKQETLLYLAAKEVSVARSKHAKEIEYPDVVDYTISQRRKRNGLGSIDSKDAKKTLLWIDVKKRQTKIIKVM